MSSNDNTDNTNKQISYTEFFRNRFKKHDAEVKKIILQLPVTPYRKKRNYQEAFNELPPYTRFTDELESTRVLESLSTP